MDPEWLNHKNNDSNDQQGDDHYCELVRTTEPGDGELGEMSLVIHLDTSN
jgi:hypothetical protein